MDTEGLYFLDDAAISDFEMLLYMGIALAVGVVAYIFVSKPHSSSARRPAGNYSDKLLGVFIAVLLGTVVLHIPILCLVQNGVILAIPQIVVRTIQIILVDSGMTDIISGTPCSAVGYAYYFLLTLCHTALPILAIVNVYDLIKRRFAHLKCWLVCNVKARNKNVYLFSKINEDTIGLADDIIKNDRLSLVVFTGVSKAEKDERGTELQDLDDRSVRFLEVQYVDTAVDFCNALRFDKLFLFSISADIEENITETCAAIEALRGSSEHESYRACTVFSDPERGKERISRIRIFAQYDSPDDETVLDAANAKSRHGIPAPPLPLVLLRKEVLASFNLLQKVPLYSVLDQNEHASPSQIRPAQQTDLDVIVLGSGSYAEAVVCNVLWAGQMHNVSLHVTVLDKIASVCEERMRMRYPALLDNTACKPPKFIDCKLLSGELLNQLEPFKNKEHLYVIAASNQGDTFNYEIALKTRMLFLEHFPARPSEIPTSPTICALIKSPTVSKLISPSFNADVGEHGITTFGARLFDYNSVIASPLEQSGQVASDLYSFLYENVDFAKFGVKDITVQDVREALAPLLGKTGETIPRSADITTMIQIKHQSNLALALHTAYKEWALGLIDASEETLGCLADSLTDEVIEIFGTCEHRRWWVMYASFGFTQLTKEQQEYYARLLRSNNSRQKIESLRKHCMLCPDEEIWDNYLHAVSSFRYLEQASAGEGNACVTVFSADSAGQVSKGLHLQLLTSDYKVLEEWVVDQPNHMVRNLLDGDYIIHPASALKGWQAASDKRFSVRGGTLQPPYYTDSEMQGTIAFSGKEKDWLGNDATLVNPVAYDWVFICAIGVLSKARRQNSNSA